MKQTSMHNNTIRQKKKQIWVVQAGCDPDFRSGSLFIVSVCERIKSLEISGDIQSACSAWSVCCMYL